MGENIKSKISLQLVLLSFSSCSKADRTNSLNECVQSLMFDYLLGLYLCYNSFYFTITGQVRHG